MDKRDLIFTTAFVISLMTLTYFLGSSITGYFILSMHCEEGVCREFCSSTSDCDTGETCCDKGNFGVCEEACEKEYELQPELDVDIGEIPLPSPEKGYIVFYSILTLLVIIIGIAYFLKGKKRKK